MSFEPIRRNNFEGYECEEFEFMGLPAKVVKPNKPANGKWALKTEYFGAFPELEIELLERGWHIAFNQNYNRWAEKEDIERKAAFINYVFEIWRLRWKN